MELFYVLLILLLAARGFGEVAKWLGQPVLVGELIAGVLVGMIAHQAEGTFPALAGLTDDDVFRAVADLGAFFLMLVAGTEIGPRELVKASRGGTAVAVTGIVVPFAIGWGIGWAVLPASELKSSQSLFIATALAITAVPTIAKVLIDLGKLKSRPGMMILSAAVVDDVLGLLLLSILVAVLETGTPPTAEGFAMLVGKIAVFFAIAVSGAWVAFRALGKFFRVSKAEELELSGLLVVGLGLAALAEVLDLHFILGAFIAGVMFGRRQMGRATFDDVRAKTAAITNGFLAPLFFVSIGLHLDASAVIHVPWFIVLLIALAIGAKLATAIPARMLGLRWPESLAVGAGMSARGAVELIIAGIALEAGLFEAPETKSPIIRYLFSSVVIMAIVTTLFPPIALKYLLRRTPEGPSEGE